MRNWFRRFFIPNEDNGYAPHALQKLSAGLMLFLVLASFAVANIQTLFLLSSDWFISTILPGVLVDLTNENREADELSHLVRSPLLDEAARLKAEDMAKGSYFAHHSPDGRSPWYWFDEVGYRYVHAGENLAVHFTESREVVEGWMDSPGHRANILNEHYREIGIGTAEGEYKGYPTIFVVQLFGTPATLALAETVIEGERAEVFAEENTPPQSAVAEAVPAEDSGPESVTVAGESTDVASNESVVADTQVEAEAKVAVGMPRIEGLTEESEREFAITEDNTLLLYSDIATTSYAWGYQRQEDIGLGSGTTPLYTAPQVSGFVRTITEPQAWLTFIYIVLGTCILVALLLSIIIEWRRQHPVQIAYGVGLIALLVLMVHIHEYLVDGVVIV